MLIRLSRYSETEVVRFQVNIWRPVRFSVAQPDTVCTPTGKCAIFWRVISQ